MSAESHLETRWRAAHAAATAASRAYDAASAAVWASEAALRAELKPPGPAGQADERALESAGAVGDLAETVRTHAHAAWLKARDAEHAAWAAFRGMKPTTTEQGDDR